MKVIFEKLTTKIASVAVIDSKKVCFHTFFLDVESDTDPILIVVPGYSLMSIDGVALDNSILFMGSLSRLDMRYFLLITLSSTLHYDS